MTGAASEAPTGPTIGEGVLPTWFRGPLEEILGRPWPDLILRATVLLLMFYGADNNALRQFLRVLGAGMLFSDKLLYSSPLWLLNGTLLALGVADTWYNADNHKWLMCYWTFVCALSVGHRERPAGVILRQNARLLIGLCFGFATLWKIIGWQYFDGHFFFFQFSFDSRFEIVTQVLGMPEAAYQYNQKAMDRTLLAREPGDGFVIVYTPAMLYAAIAFCWWTIFIEYLIFHAYIFRAPRWLHEHRDWTLLAFIFTTYLLAPVVGFGSVLIIMGLAQCDRHRVKTRALYLFSLFVLHLGNIFTKLAVDKFVE